jgi:hypothetical protein
MIRPSCRSVIFAFGHRRHAAQLGRDGSLEVVNAGDVLHDAVALVIPNIDAERKVVHRRPPR